MTILKKNSALVELKEIARNDYFTARDVSDTTSQATGETKRVSQENIIPSFGYFPYQLTEHDVDVASGFCHTVSLPQSKTISSNSYSLGGDGDLFIKEF